MQKHIKIFREFYGIGDQDQPPSCAICNRNPTEIHHVTSRGLKSFEWKGEAFDINHILNLIALCRDCHSLAHGGTHTKHYLYKINEARILNESK